METLDCIAFRRSIRKYKEEDVDLDTIGRIVLAGRDAPSSGNLQNWRFIIVKDEGKRASIAEACFGQLWMAKAPVHLIVCAEPEKASQFYGVRGERLYSIQNCAAATQNMILAASDLGVGSCWVGAFDEDQLSGILGIPDNARPQAIITLGYADEVPRDPPWKHEIYTITFLEGYGGRMKNIDHVLGYHSEKVHRAINLTKDVATKTPNKLKKVLHKSKETLKNVHQKLKDSRTKR